MKEKRKMKLSTQINLIFLAVTILTSMVFLFALSRLLQESRIQQNKDQLNAYYNEVIQNPYARPQANRYNGYIFYHSGTSAVLYSNNVDILGVDFTSNPAQRLFIWYSARPGFEAEEEIKGSTYYFRFYRVSPDNFIIVFTKDAYMQNINPQYSPAVLVSLIAIILLGNVTILVWSRVTVDRVRALQTQVGQLTRNQYKVPISSTGSDEITDLGRTIEKMRIEIESSENIKQEMLQNISHDFKTPIAVIRSYAEAIRDGVSDLDGTQIIIKQADLLNQKVMQLLELNKLEYLKDPSEFEDVLIKELIVNLVNQHKYLTPIEIETKLDDSTYVATKENLTIAFANILDNAMRYAKKKIKITLKDKKLTFYNDGEPISEKFIEQLFKPYEKGNQGQFGLGMSIVQKTCEHFNLFLTVRNVDVGVEFIIEPY